MLFNISLNNLKFFHFIVSKNINSFLRHSLKYKSMFTFVRYPTVTCSLFKNMYFVYTCVSYRSKVNISSRTMLSRVLPTASFIVKPTCVNTLNKITVPHRKSAISIYKPDPKLMTHEECENNVILGSKKSIQHPTLAITHCSEPECEKKKCNSPCEPEKKPVAFGHVTHGDAYPGVIISKTDLKKKLRSQYGRFYKKRVEVSEPEKTLDVNATKELNENKEMNDNVRMLEKFHQ